MVARKAKCLRVIRQMSSFFAGATALVLVAAPELAVARDFIDAAEEKAVKEGEAET